MCKKNPNIKTRTVNDSNKHCANLKYLFIWHLFLTFGFEGMEPHTWHMGKKCMYIVATI